MQNYSYQPYQPYQAFQPQIPTLSGKIVDDFSLVSANDVPMDGNVAIFPKRDLSEIQIRRWMPNGQITMIPYKPISEVLDTKQVNVSNEPKQSEIDTLNDLIQSLSDKIDALADKMDKPRRTANDKS